VFSVGFRPSRHFRLSGNGALGAGQFCVDAQGTFSIRIRADGGAWFSFDGCSFSTE
jgi:hypothetical protein